MCVLLWDRGGQVSTCQVDAGAEQRPAGEEGEESCGIIGGSKKAQALKEEVRPEKYKNQAKHGIDSHPAIAPAIQSTVVHMCFTLAFYEE